MAYFGRKPKKPGSVPGAASGFSDDRGGPVAPRQPEGPGHRVWRPSRASRPQRMTRVFRAERRAR